MSDQNEPKLEAYSKNHRSFASKKTSKIEEKKTKHNENAKL